MIASLRALAATASLAAGLLLGDAAWSQPAAAGAKTLRYAFPIPSGRR